MSTATPLVTIGLPVYNGERFVADAIASLLAQVGVDFELVISDNGSTDATEEICRAAIAGDERARYERHDVNRGAAWNYNHLVHVARGRYFKWAAHDDMCAPTFVARCVEVMEADPEVSLCYPRAIDIDEHRDVIREYPSLQYADEPTPAARARAVLRNATPCFESFGVMRRDQLLSTDMIGAYTSSDRTLFFELALRGRFHEVPEPLFLHRQHEGRSVFSYDGARARNAWFDPARAERHTSPRWRLVVEHVRATRRAPLSAGERVRVSAAIPPWVGRNAQGLGREAATWAAHRLRRPRRDRAAKTTHDRLEAAEAGT